MGYSTAVLPSIFSIVQLYSFIMSALGEVGSLGQVQAALPPRAPVQCIEGLILK